jgi:hypothetical protein
VYKNSNNKNHNLFLRIDDAIMRGVNKTVRAWNWTTGKTKADLANTLLICGAAVNTYILNFGLDTKPEFLNVSLTAGIFGTTIYPMINQNNRIQRQEIDAIKNNTLDGKVEEYKKSMQIWCPLLFSGGNTIAIKFAASGETMDGKVLGVIVNSIVTSQYVMRADYLPPRKNIFARGLNHLKEYLRRTQSIPIPAAGSLIRREL